MLLLGGFGLVGSKCSGWRRWGIEFGCNIEGIRITHKGNKAPIGAPGRAGHAGTHRANTFGFATIHRNHVELSITTTIGDEGDLPTIGAPHRGAVVACTRTKTHRGCISTAHPDGTAVCIGNRINTCAHIDEGSARWRPCHVFDVVETGDIGHTPRGSSHARHPFRCESCLVLYREATHKQHNTGRMPRVVNCTVIGSTCIRCSLCHPAKHRYRSAGLWHAPCAPARWPPYIRHGSAGCRCGCRRHSAG